MHVLNYCNTKDFILRNIITYLQQLYFNYNLERSTYIYIYIYIYVYIYIYIWTLSLDTSSYNRQIHDHRSKQKWTADSTRSDTNKRDHLISGITTVRTKYGRTPRGLRHLYIHEISWLRTDRIRHTTNNNCLNLPQLRL